MHPRVRILLAIATVVVAKRPQRVSVPSARSESGAPTTANCTERWATVEANHFVWAAPVDGADYDDTFAMRYFTNTEYWGGPGYPIWFYTGNEANVEQYVNATGLMWENAAEHQAMLVFAEHRFYGQTWPCGGEEAAQEDCLHLLTTEQAAADYVELLALIKSGAAAADIAPCPTSPVIAFGGSYGGMLAAWVRMKYPGTFNGAISASAPILGFIGTALDGEGHGFYDDGGAGYWDIVQADTTQEKGAAPACSANLGAGFELIAKMSTDSAGRAALSDAFGLCPDAQVLDESDADGYRLQMWVLYAFDDYAMGNYPFASTYLEGPDALSPLPPFPMRAACEHLADDTLSDEGSEAALMDAVAAAVNLLYNSSGAEKCYESIPARDDELDGIWDYQWCTQMACQETYFSRRPSGIWPEYSFNLTWVNERCQGKYGPHVTPRATHVAQHYGGGGGGGGGGGRAPHPPPSSS
mmetsp:Transcript_44411/g.121026  ORF Transcript_44411/g.121026 Transcript_44411/m.121026 type:complete len:469 (+) Transcript_44411:70-1476(+)